MAENNTAYLLTGSNMGDREAHLNHAKALIEKHIGTVKEISRLYETQAWGKTDQPNFYNQALAVETNQFPQQVLKNILKIEQEMGRIRTEKWEERVIDIDILLFNEEIIEDDNLKIPHPHLHERNFALVPLMDVAGEVMHPVLNLPVEEVYFECRDTLEVFMVENE
jgi:2-amino-4-hydroxy-6-hydroxymethyldihydropteridine diphosphokinase